MSRDGDGIWPRSRSNISATDHSAPFARCSPAGVPTSAPSWVKTDGEADHVHLLVASPPHVAVARLVNPLKGVSARRLRQRNRVRIHREQLWSPSYVAASAGDAPREGRCDLASVLVVLSPEPWLLTSSQDRSLPLRWWEGDSSLSPQVEINLSLAQSVQLGPCASVDAPLEPLRAAATRQLRSTNPHGPPLAGRPALVQWPATRGLVVGVVVGIPRWHARGQGFKSPQLHPWSG
jgi:hypothetical protein